MILVLIAGLIYLESTQLAPKRFKTRLETVSSPLVPESMSDLTLAIATDLMGDTKAMQKTANAVNKYQSDILVLTGDTFGTGEDVDAQAAFLKTLKTINPKYGKFALINTEADRDLFEGLGFHVVTKNLLKIHTDSESYINLQTSNTIDVMDIDAPDTFNILISNQIQKPPSSGFQVEVYPVNPQDYIKVPGLLNHFQTKEQKDESLILRHMGSNTLSEYRLFTNPELLLLTLKSQ